MKFTVIISFMLFSLTVIGQTNPKPFSLANQATSWLKNEEQMRKKMMNQYDGNWTLDFTYGQRHIASKNKAGVVDTVTLTDFTSRKTFYGIGAHYFIKKNLSVGLGLNILFLPKEQDINFNGSSGSGSGSGGLMVNFGPFMKYYVTDWSYARPYFSIGLSSYQLVATGGEIEFTFSGGNEGELNKENIRTGGVSVGTGITYRIAPASMLDFNLSYANTAEHLPIGGITSPGGLNVSFSFQFILD